MQIVNREEGHGEDFAFGEDVAEVAFFVVAAGVAGAGGVEGF